MSPRPFRALAILIAGALAAAFLVQILDKTYPVRSWLSFTLLAIYGWQLFLTVACAGFGRFVLLRVLRLRDLSGLETLALGLPVGLVGFAFAMFLGGYLRLYGPWLAMILPGLMSATWFLTRPSRMSSWMRLSLMLRPTSLLVAVYGMVCLAVMYLAVLSPDALNYDSTWCHLVVSQDYAREGRIVPFLANWTKNVPHMASIVQTWGFLVPGPWPIDHPVRWMLALHTEFTIFLWTLVGVSAAIDWLSARRVTAAWAAFFLFPSIFVYDSSLGGAADHFLALFAVPLLLAGARVARTFDRADCALLGILAAGATMTKLQSIYMIGPLVVILACRWLQLAARRLRAAPEALDWKSLSIGPLVALVCFLVIASPQAIENFVWFHNPLYPFMQRTFIHSTPTMPGAAQMVDNLYADWRWQAPPKLSTRFSEALQLAFTFSFEPHYSFIGPRPYFGFLFTLLSPLILFLPAARRVWWGFAIGMGALFVWGFTYRVDRNLQTFLPILVVVTGAIIARAWELGLMARLGILPLIALQVAWGADLMFTGNDRLQAGVALLKSGFDGHAADRFDSYRRNFREAGKAIPEDGLAVLHNWHLTLGMNRRILLDWVGYQGLIDYRTFSTPRAAYDRFASLGVTHFIVPGAHPADTKQEEVIFDTFASLYAKHQSDAGGFAIYAMPAAPPPPEQPFRVLAIGMGGYADGVYGIQDLGTIEAMPPALQQYAAPMRPAQSAEQIEQMLGDVDAVLLASARHLETKGAELLREKFRVVGGHGPFNVYARVSPQPG